MVCKSDHFALTFELKLKFKHKKPLKIKTYNYNINTANWCVLNRDLNSINWLLNLILDSQELDIAWSEFKQVLNCLLQIHIPTMTIKSDFQPPWFDSECYIKCMEKERLHSKYKLTKSISDDLKFMNCRREFKSLINK